MAFAQPAAAPVPGEYPIQLNVTTERDMNRLWGIPGAFVVRLIACLPHAVVLWILNWALTLWLLLGWIYILAFGRVPAIAVKLIVEYMHRSNRVAGYLLLMPGEYPRLEPGIPGPTNFTAEFTSLEINRWWGIPGIGFCVRLLVVLPQLILLSLLAATVVLSYCLLWIPILVNGRYPNWAANFYGSVLKWGAQVGAYVCFLPVRYPPFWMN